MRHLMILILALSLYPLSAQETRSTQAILQERLLQMEAERDRSERAFLELQAETRPVIDELTREKRLLEDQLRRIQQEGLLLDSAQETTARAETRADQALEDVRRELEAVQSQLLAEQQEFAETLNRLRMEQQRLIAERDQERAEIAENREALQQRLEDLLNQMAQTEAAANALKANQETLEQEARDIQGLNRQLTSDLEQAQRRESLANAQLNALQSRVEHLQVQLQEAFEERSRAEQQRDQLAQRVHELEAELAQIREQSVPRAELETLQQTLQDLTAQNEELRAALDEEQRRPDFAQDLARTERERDLLDAKLKTMETRVQEAEARAGREETRRREISAANTSLLDHIVELETSLTDLQTIREAQAEDLQTLREQQQRLENQLQSMDEKLEAASVDQTNFEALQVEFVTLQNDLIAREELTREQALAIEDLQRALGASMQEVERTRRELEALESGQTDPGELEAERVRMQAAQTQAMRDMRILANHIQTLRNDLRQQQERQQRSEEERQVLLNRIRELEARSLTP